MSTNPSNNKANVSSQILQIYPNYLTIPNFSTKHNYKEKITLYNISPYHMVFTLTSSDPERMKISNSYIKLNGGQTKHIYLMIRDNVKYFNDNNPHQRRIFLIIKSDLFEERFPIDLLYNTFDHKEILIQNYTAHQQYRNHYIPEIKEEVYANQNNYEHMEESYYEIIAIQNVIQFEIVNDDTENEEKDAIINNLKEEKKELVSYVNNTLMTKWKQMENLLQRYDNELLYKCYNMYNNNNLCFSKQNYFSVISENSNVVDNENIISDDTSIPNINELNTLKSHNNLLFTENVVLAERISLIEAKLALLPPNKLTK